MRSTPAVFRFLCCLLMLAILSPLIAQEKPLTATGQVKVGVHKYKMEAGKLYQLKVDGDGFSRGVIESASELHLGAGGHGGWARNIAQRIIGTDNHGALVDGGGALWRAL